MTFTIFSGPKSITTFILINALVVFASVYVRGSLVVLFGSFVIITSLIVYMKSLYNINKTMMTINTRSRPEKDDEV
jgi:glucan phosphoethanolaminetransferase (alkaline phosphatase superfamily)